MPLGPRFRWTGPWLQGRTAGHAAAAAEGLAQGMAMVRHALRGPDVADAREDHHLLRTKEGECAPELSDLILFQTAHLPYHV